MESTLSISQLLNIRSQPQAPFLLTVTYLYDDFESVLRILLAFSPFVSSINKLPYAQTYETDITAFLIFLWEGFNLSSVISLLNLLQWTKKLLFVFRADSQISADLDRNEDINNTATLTPRS